jgi:hypothetical protein
VKRETVHHVLWAGAVAALFALAYSYSITNGRSSYEQRLWVSQLNLRLARYSISLFKEQVGRFPESLEELDEYGKKHPHEIDWRWPYGETISRRRRTEGHAQLDGSGGFFYDPESGDIRVNLTKPLHHYWRRYSGKRRDEIPADW